MQINSSISAPDVNLTVRKIDGKTDIANTGFPYEEKASEQKRDRPERLQELKNTLAENGIALKFSQNDETNQLVVEMVDNKTGEIIRQLPSEVSVKLAEVYNGMQGQIVDEHF